MVWAGTGRTILAWPGELILVGLHRMIWAEARRTISAWAGRMALVRAVAVITVESGAATTLSVIVPPVGVARKEPLAWPERMVLAGAGRAILVWPGRILGWAAQMMLVSVWRVVLLVCCRGSC